MKRALAAGVAAAVAILCAHRADAHEIGKTQASAAFQADGTYHIEINVDPDALLTKLEVFSSTAISSSVDREERDRRIASLAGVFLEEVTVRFDGVRDHPMFEYLPVSRFSDVAQAPSLVRLTGVTPRGARDVTIVRTP